MPRYEVAKIDELGTAYWQHWHQIQRADPTLASPYFRPEFASAVASVGRDVRVCVIEDDRGVVGLFPFERARYGLGGPVGGCLSDYHGVIAAKDAGWSPRELLRACGLTLWRYDHVPSSQREFGPFHRRHADSPAVDLAHGFAAYAQGLRARGSQRLQSLLRKSRKLARERGPVRFEAHTTDAGVLRSVLAWKSAQCRRTGVVDFFTRWPWTRELVSVVAGLDSGEMRGVVSALWAGDRLVAAHLGMRSASTLHWWFPVYDRDHAEYSPGAILLLRVLEDAAAQGVRIVDLGKGDDAYKASFANTATVLAEGVATPHAFSHGLIRATRATAQRLRSSGLVAPLRPALRAVRRMWSAS